MYPREVQKLVFQSKETVLIVKSQRYENDEDMSSDTVWMLRAVTTSRKCVVFLVEFAFLVQTSYSLQKNQAH